MIVAARCTVKMVARAPRWGSPARFSCSPVPPPRAVARLALFPIRVLAVAGARVWARGLLPEEDGFLAVFVAGVVSGRRGDISRGKDRELPVVEIAVLAEDRRLRRARPDDERSRPRGSTPDRRARDRRDPGRPRTADRRGAAAAAGTADVRGAPLRRLVVTSREHPDPPRCARRARGCSNGASSMYGIVFVVVYLLGRRPGHVRCRSSTREAARSSQTGRPRSGEEVVETSSSKRVVRQRRAHATISPLRERAWLVCLLRDSQPQAINSKVVLRVRRSRARLRASRRTWLLARRVFTGTETRVSPAAALAPPQDQGYGELETGCRSPVAKRSKRNG